MTAIPIPTLARQVEEGEAALRASMRELALKDLWFFLTEVLFHPNVECTEDKTDPAFGGPEGCCWKRSVFHEPLHRGWCEWAQDDSLPRRGLLAPRGHFKSSVISFGKSVHTILRRPNIRILLISALEENATNFAKQVKTAFQYNDRMRWLFPDYWVEPGKQFGPSHWFTSPARTDRSLAAPTFYATYLDAALASQHYDLILMDDPIEARHVATEEQAAKARASYNKIIPLLDPGGNVIITGTRWSHMDLYSGLVPETLGGTATSSRYNWIVRSCFETGGKPDFDSGDPIFPTRWPRSALLALLEEYRADPALGEQFWWNQYMNSCRSPANQPFFEEWFKEVLPENVPPLMVKMIVVDTALKDDAVYARAGASRGDYTVIIVGGFDASGRLFILAGLRSNAFTSKLFTDALIAYSQRYQAMTVVRQKVGEDTLGTTIRDAFAMVRAPVDYRPITVTTMGRKQQRIKDALQGPMQKEEIWWVRQPRGEDVYEPNPLLYQAKKELLHLGQFPTDDVADALANFFHPDVKIRRVNLIGQPVWKIPGVPSPQLGTNSYQLWMRYRRGAGYTPGGDTT
jgi:hypothetical protein